MRANEALSDVQDHTVPDTSPSQTQDPILLTIDEAYAAAFLLIQKWYDLGPTEEVLDLLHAMYLNAPRQSSDPALWDDWCQAVQAAKRDTNRRE
jgi:hypothetical protein